MKPEKRFPRDQMNRLAETALAEHADELLLLGVAPEAAGATFQIEAGHFAFHFSPTRFLKKFLSFAPDGYRALLMDGDRPAAFAEIDLDEKAKTAAFGRFTCGPEVAALHISLVRLAKSHRRDVAELEFSVLKFPVPGEQFIRFGKGKDREFLQVLPYGPDDSLSRFDERGFRDYINKIIKTYRDEAKAYRKRLRQQVKAHRRRIEDLLE